ncbi:MAG: hypothetical protein ACI4IF_08110 [Acutalibacteraceae bacterium]
MAKKIKVKVADKNNVINKATVETDVNIKNENTGYNKNEGSAISIGNVKIPICNPSFRKLLLKIPVFLIVPFLYVVLGKLTHLWHPLWMMFFFIPVYYQFAVAVGTKTFKGFLLNLPVIPLVVLVYLISGFTLRLWSFSWVLFLIIPVYYWLVAVMKK